MQSHKVDWKRAEAKGHMPVPKPDRCCWKNSNAPRSFKREWTMALRLVWLMPQIHLGIIQGLNVVLSHPSPYLTHRLQIAEYRFDTVSKKFWWRWSFHFPFQSKSLLLLCNKQWSLNKAITLTCRYFFCCLHWWIHDNDRSVKKRNAAVCPLQTRSSRQLYTEDQQVSSSSSSII